MTHDRYALTQRLLHWLIAVLVIGAIAGGWLIGEFKSSDLPDGLYNQIYALHKSVGVLILALMAVRIVLRLSLGAPAPHPGLADWQARAAGFVHFAFYALLIAQPVLGMLGVWFFPAPIPIFGLGDLPNPLGKDRELSKQLLEIHEIIGKVLLALAVVHIGAAVMHLSKKDGVFRRIALWNRNTGPGGG